MADPVTPEQFTRAVADQTRLRMLVLLLAHPELCVCELTEALRLPQPKVSRHLAVLRGAGILLDRRAGLWIHYRVHPELPAWALKALAGLAEGCAGRKPYAKDAKILSRLADTGGLHCA